MRLSRSSMAFTSRGMSSRADAIANIARWSLPLTRPDRAALSCLLHQVDKQTGALVDDKSWVPRSPNER
jgi:hypothetical protein